MNRDQRTVAVGAASGVASMLLLTWLLYRALPEPAGSDQIAVRIAYALRRNALAALPLFAMLAAIGNARFLSEAIDPTLGNEDHKMIVNGRVADSTLQQFALFWAGSLALAAALPPSQVRLIGAAAIVFALLRITFWIGYHIFILIFYCINLKQRKTDTLQSTHDHRIYSSLFEKNEFRREAQGSTGPWLAAIIAPSSSLRSSGFPTGSWCARSTQDRRVDTLLRKGARRLVGQFVAALVRVMSTP